MPAGEPLDADLLVKDLGVRRIARSVRVIPEAPSTNQLCLDAADARNDGLVVFAEYQSVGRGRLGRTWLAPRGSSLLFSALLIEPPKDVRPERWALLTGVAVAEAVRSETDLDVLLKWPNDIVVRRGGTARKLGGILIETRRLPSGDAQACVIGVGLNCLQQAGHFPPELRDRATSLELECSGPIDRLSLARRLLKQLDHTWASPPTDAALRQHWLDLALPMLGAHVRLLADARVWAGTIVDLDPAEGLVVQLADGPRRTFGLETTWLDPDDPNDAAKSSAVR
jgi:BirA family biotin operon repressor/biotin-[acetyl-CoA-carboxylase] ligase